MDPDSRRADDLSVITAVIARNRRDTLILAALGPVLAFIGRLSGSQPALLGLTGAGLVCAVIALCGFRSITRAGQALTGVLRDRPSAITTVATVTLSQRTPTGIPLSREHAIIVRLDNGIRYSLRSLTIEDQTTILALLHRLAPNASRTTGQV